MSEVDLIEIDLQNLVLGELCVENQSQKDLRDLAAPGPLLGEEARLDDLLVDGRAALGDAAGTEIGPERAGHSDRVDADVVAEADVFRGHECERDEVGKRGQRDGRRSAPAGAIEDRYPRPGVRGENDCRLAPAMAYELAREAVVEQRDVAARKGDGRPHRQRDRNHPAGHAHRA